MTNAEDLTYKSLKLRALYIDADGFIRYTPYQNEAIPMTTTYKWDGDTHSIIVIPEGCGGGGVATHGFSNIQNAAAWLARLLRPGDFVSIGGIRERI